MRLATRRRREKCAYDNRNRSTFPRNSFSSRFEFSALILLLNWIAAAPGSSRIFLQQSRHGYSRGCAAVLLMAFVLLLTSPTVAQRVQLGPEGEVQSENLGRAFETFSIFGGTPGIAAAQYYSEFRLNNFQLPITHTFGPIDGGQFASVAPYAEITLDYLNGDRTFPLEPSPTTPTSVKLSFDSWSALAGLGLELRFGDGLRLRPIILAGYAHVGGDATFTGPNSAFFRTAVRGILSDSALDMALAGGALELVYDTRFHNDLNLTARARYNEVVAIVTGATDPSLKQNGSFGVATASVTLDGPTDWHIASHAIRWLGYARGTWLPNTNRGILGFNSFAEIGGGLRLIAPDVIRGVQGGTVRVSAIVGPGVTGWLVGAALDF